MQGFLHRYLNIWISIINTKSVQNGVKKIYGRLYNPTEMKTGRGKWDLRFIEYMDIGIKNLRPMTHVGLYTLQ